MLFRRGFRDADELLAEFDAVGDGDEDILISILSSFMSDTMSFEGVAMIPCVSTCPLFLKDPRVS